MRHTKQIFILCIVFKTLFFTEPLQAIISQANVTTVAINNSIIDPATGDFYVSTGTAGGTDRITVAKISFPGKNDTSLTATTYYSSANAADAVNALAISRTTNTSRLCFNLNAGTNPNFIRCYDGTVEGIMAAAATDNDGNAGLVKALAANTTTTSTAPAYVFSAVGDSVTNWLGDQSSCVNAHLIASDTLIPAAATAGTRALLTNLAGGPFAIAAKAIYGISPLLVFDEIFSKLYIMNNSSTVAGGAGNGVRSLAIVNVNLSTGALTQIDIKTNPLTDWGDANTKSNIVGVIKANQILSVHNFGIMHTSTGYSYLIVNGGNGDLTDTRDATYALPLVTKGFTNEGTLADITSPNFNTQASTSETLISKENIAAQVGDGLAPWQPGSIPVDMQIVGDCVYLSQGAAASNDDQGGVVYSQALFGQEGKIVRWTRWSRAFSIFMGIDNVSGSVQTFAVDARSGQTWSVQTNSSTVRFSNWGDTVSTEIAANIKANANGGVFCSYHLNGTSENFGNAATGRYSLFGGNERVVFIRTTFATVAPTDYTQPANESLVDFVVGTNDDNIKVTTLPAGAGEVRCLGYSHWALGADQGFFFAGTDEGLYVYAVTANGAGFDYTAENDLNASVWATANSWQAIANVVGSVRKIKSIGNKVYILARDNSGTTTVDRLYGVAVYATVGNINTNIETLAVTNTGNLVDIDSIVDFDIIRANPTSTTATANGDGGIQEQVVLLTNNGIYQSFAVAGLNAAANNTQAEALWGKISPLVANRVFSSSNTSSPSSLSIVEIANAADAPNTYMRRNLRQAFVNGARLEINAKPQNSSSNTSFLTLDRITNYWSDAGRRLFIYTSDSGSSTFGSLPYDISTYNMSEYYGPSDALIGETNLYDIGLMANGQMIITTGGTPESIIM